jgi:tyrosine phenol-lyase
MIFSVPPCLRGEFFGVSTWVSLQCLGGMSFARGRAMSPSSPRHEPHKIKTVRLIAFPTLEERKRNLLAASFNVFNLTPAQVTYDMCSYGTSAVSQEQLAGQLVGDEAYAGARNFENLVRAVGRVFGHSYVCPTHNNLGALKLLVATLIPPGSIVPTNARAVGDVLEPRGLRCPNVRSTSAPVFTGDLDLSLFAEQLAGSRASLVFLQAFADGQHPLSLQNLAAVRALADRHGLRVALDASRILENAWYIQRHEPGQGDRSVAEIVKQCAKSVHLLLLDGAEDPKCNAGGVLTTDNPADHERFIQEVVVYEGLHTYGGMAGRTMEVLARGIEEMVDEAEVQWIMHQTEAFTAQLREAGVPLERGSDGAYLLADRFLPHLSDHQQHALSAALYLTSGIRAVATGRVGDDRKLPVQIPRLAMTTRQLERIADAIIELHRHRASVAALDPMGEAHWHDQLRFRSIFANLPSFEWDTYPFVIHTVERVGELSQDQRRKAIREAGYNTFLLRSADVTIDLLTDSGTSAMSTDQWAAYEAARATPCTSEAYQRFVAVMREVYGYEHILPTHQGRAAEHVLSQSMIKKGQVRPRKHVLHDHQGAPGARRRRLRRCDHRRGARPFEHASRGRATST